MLVLTRKMNQGIRLGDSIEITVLEIKDDSVRIGINAPKEIVILRKELYESVSDANIKAVVSDSESIEMLKSLLPPDGRDKKK